MTLFMNGNESFKKRLEGKGYLEESYRVGASVMYGPRSAVVVVVDALWDLLVSKFPKEELKGNRCGLLKEERWNFPRTALTHAAAAAALLDALYCLYPRK